MTELERLAMMGDREAQKQCTEQGIVLPCPKCFKPVNVHGPEDWHPTFEDPDSGGDPYSFACECGLVFGMDKYDFKEALANWNTRPAPPTGKCENCEYSCPSNQTDCVVCVGFGFTVSKDDTCLDYKPIKTRNGKEYCTDQKCQCMKCKNHYNECCNWKEELKCPCDEDYDPDYVCPDFEPKEEPMK